MSEAIPFEQIQGASLAQIDRLPGDWFPQGKRSGHEFKIGNIHGDAGESLAINTRTGKWSDFAAQTSGFDLIDLRAAMTHGGDRVNAARELGQVLGITVTEPAAKNTKALAEDWRPMVPPPPDAKRPPESMFNGFDVTYEYTDATDHVTHYVGRIEARDGRDKIFVPIVFGVHNGVRGCHKKHPAAPKPLYGLNRLSSVPDAVVILCEGEKSADAAQQMFPDHACISYFGGTGSVDHADLTPLERREVII